MSDLLQACSGYALEPSELSAFRNLLLFQNTDISTRTLTAIENDAYNFILWIDRLSGCYKDAISAKHKAYYDRLFDKFCEEDDLAILHQMLYYCIFACNIQTVREPWPQSDNWHGFWEAYRHGKKIIESFSFFSIEPGVVIPTAPQNWKKKIENLLAGWGDNPPKKYILGDIFTRNSYVIQQGQPDAVKNCVHFPNITKRITSLWDLQWQDLQALHALNNLDNGSYFYLLHLLIGLGSGNNKMADYVARLANARTSTEAYPEETFINQLTYLVLMYLGDPNEPGEKYCLNNDGMRAMFNELKSVIYAIKPGSNAIQQSIRKQLHQMNVLSFYPILDQETSISLAERKAMTRNALLKTFKATSFEAPDTLRSQHNLKGEATEETRMILKAPIVD